jgi:flagella basal body P-ring formation protein FlgA
MRLFVNLLISLVITLLYGPLGAVEPISVHIRESVTVSADIATLADVAELSGDADTIAVLSVLPIVQLPDLATKHLDGLVITMAIGRNLGSRFQVFGTGTVRRQAETISVDTLSAAAQSAITIGEDDVELSVIRHSGAVIIPAGGAAYRFVTDVLDRHLSGDIPVRIRILRGEVELARALVTVRVVRYRTVVVAARSLQRGELLGLGDFHLQRLVMTTQLATSLTDINVVAGQEIRTDLEMGTPILESMLIQPPAVRAGQTVNLVVSTAHFQIMGSAVALGNGRIGELINVRRQTDGRTVRGRVEANGVVTFER